jgi:hypothetical protein
MKQLIKTRLFLMIEESSQTGYNSSTWQDAYDEFANILFTATNLERNKITFYHILCYTHVEFSSLHTQLAHGLEKKCFSGSLFE